VLAGACTTLVVDEAGTCADASIVPVLPRNAGGGTFLRILLVGDSSQLPPFSRLKVHPGSPDEAVSLIERIDNAVGSSMLTTQYRMFEQLSSLISILYYNGRLSTGKLDALGELCVHPVAGTAEAEERGFSLFNSKEARKVAELAEVRAANGGSVAILAFYKAQTRMLSELLGHWPNIEIMSVDAAQGQEFDHVVLSGVVSGDRRWFLEDRRRMNVALSRAKVSLDVVAHPSLLSRNDALAAAQASAAGDTVALGRPVQTGFPIQRGRGRFGRGRGRGGRR
jgi:superfamily I DNA and/or RNA helicase